MLSKIGNSPRKIMHILNGQQRALGLLVIIMALIAAALEMIGVSVVLPLINAFVAPEELLQNKYIAVLADLFSITDEKQLVLATIFVIIAVYIFKNLFFVFFSWLRLKYSYKIEREFSVMMMSSYMNRGYLFFLEHNTGELIQGAINDVRGIYNYLMAASQLITQTAMVIAILAFLCMTDIQLSIAVMISTVVCIVIIVVVFKNIVADAAKWIRKYTILSNRYVLETFHGVKEVLVNRKQKHFVDRYENNVINTQKKLIVRDVSAEIPAYIIEMVCITGIMLMISMRIIGDSDNTGIISVLATFAVGAFRILPAIGKISNSINGLISSTPNVEAVYDNITEARAYIDKNTKSIEDSDHMDTEFDNAIVVRDLSFGYDEEKLGLVLDGINLEIEKGKSIALVGKSGAGKTTLGDIILGLLKPVRGSVLKDGIDIASIPDSWAHTIGFVPQSIYLSDATVRENVAFGVNPEEIDDDRVRSALEEASILDFVETLPEGINTELGDRGVRISGGQRQRIGIARALYDSPKILVLDEATSALDNDTERSVMEAIENLHGKMTLIIIAHRLETIKKCDEVYEIADGGIRKR